MKFASRILVGLLLLSSASGQSLSSSLETGTPVVVSEKRIDRVTFEYRLRVPITNHGFSDIRGLAATAWSRSPHTKVVETAIAVGEVPARASVNSDDTITIHHDRTVPFDAGVLDWVFARDSGVQVAPGSQWRRVAAWGQSFGIQTDGTLWAWGRNNIGQLGDGTTIDRHEPVQIGEDHDWVSTAESNQDSIALRGDGSLWGWGKNSLGHLGNGTRDPSLNPVRIGSDSNWNEVGAGSAHFVAKKDNGSLWTWGLNDKGQLGDGLPSSRTSPAAIAVGEVWKSFSCGGSHTLAIREDGTLWGWGWNTFGQVGDGTTKNQRGPVQIGSDSNWASVSAGHHSSVALKRDGSLWAWGYNIYGENGDGTREMNLTPIQMGSERDWSVVQIGVTSVGAIKEDGSLWAWGRNHVSQLGGGLDQQQQAYPVRIGSRTDWISFGRGGFHCLAIAANRSLWAWGSDRFGRLGDGPSPAALSLTPVGSANLEKVEVSANFVEVFFRTLRGHSYLVEQSDDLIAWSPVGKPVSGSGSRRRLRFDRAMNGPVRMFYRVRQIRD